MASFQTAGGHNNRYRASFDPNKQYVTFKDWENW